MDGSFAAIAFLLSIVGLYGVERTWEIGVRMALGAKPRSIYQMILKEAGLLAFLGTSVGIISSVAGAKLIRARYGPASRLFVSD